jgi:hypothetical protein
VFGQNLTFTRGTRGGMNKKKFIILLIFIVALGFVWGCYLLPPQYNPRYSVKRVSSLPSGFMLLDEAEVALEGIADFVFWSNHVAIFDTKSQDLRTRCIYLTDVKNADFIVQYKGKYYINEIIYRELINRVCSESNKRDDK